MPLPMAAPACRMALQEAAGLFCVPSRSAHTPARQVPFTQSPPTRHFLPTAHLGQPPLPPQSTSVSAPFLIRSLQVTFWHTLLVHTPEAQSRGSAQPSPSAQAGQVAPPQSTSVSSPSLTLLLQVKAWQTLPMHTVL